jgi:hypothetical protein
LKVLELTNTLIHEAWLGDNSCGWAKRSVFKISNSNGDQVGSNLDIVLKGILLVVLVNLLDLGLVGAHLYDKVVLDSDLGVVGDLNGWSVLHWSHRSASNVLALGEEIWQNATGSLGWGQPVDGGGVLVGSVIKLQGKLLVEELWLDHMHLDWGTEEFIWGGDVKLNLLPARLSIMDSLVLDFMDIKTS